ncbi:MAG: HNH endonuclease [Paraclostridium sp.]
MITKEVLHELFEYKDGEIYWKESPARGVKKGQKAGTPTKYGDSVGVLGKRFYKHKLIFTMFHGYYPSTIVFKDGNCSNSCIENLKEVTRARALTKSRIRKDNISGYKGVSWSNSRNKWVGVIVRDKQRKHLGYFEDKEIANEFYQKEAANYNQLEEKNETRIRNV